MMAKDGEVKYDIGMRMKCRRNDTAENVPTKHIIAMWRTMNRMDFNDNIRSIMMATDDVSPGRHALFSGYGQTKFGGQYADTVKFAWMTILSNEECLERVPNAEVLKETVCADVLVRPGGLCFGDHGGPLVVENRLVGILSWVNDECKKAEWIPQNFALFRLD